MSVDAHVAHVTLNRPDKHNAVNMEMFTGLAAAGDDISADAGIRAVVLSDAGGNFCAGIDISLFGSGETHIDESSMAPVDGSPANLFQRAAYVWREVPVPVVCALEGVAFGAGLQIALGADIRYAAPGTRLSVMEIKWGLIPDMAISTTARHVVPVDKLKELAYTGRVVDASEAQAIGLVTSLHDDPLAAAMATAAEIAGKSPTAVRAIKRLFHEAWDDSDAAALRLEAALQSGLMGTPNQVESVRANMEKRAPRFAD